MGVTVALDLANEEKTQRSTIHRKIITRKHAKTNQNIRKALITQSKSFSKSFTSIDYLKLKEVTNIHSYTDWLKIQIKQKEQEILSE